MFIRTRLAQPFAVLALALASLSPLLMPPAPARAQAASGVKVSVLHAAYIASTLTVGPDGSFFGTQNDYPGTIFKVTLGGLFHPLINFNYDNGGDPTSGPLLLLPDGSFFGSTYDGGKSNTGVLFQFTPTRRYQIKHEFSSLENAKNVRGANPQMPLVLGTDGAIYGATYAGGSAGGGVIFRWTAAKGVEVVRSIPASSFGPSGLTLGPDGALYGTLVSGGSNFYGQIFRCTTTGDFTILHTFAGTDGASPLGVPIVGSDGALYGAAQYGGGGGGGVVYRITTGGDFTVLHQFASGSPQVDASSPLVMGPDGKLYGTTAKGGDGSGGGSVYRITTAGAFSELYSTSENYNVGSGFSAPVFGRDNRLYVTGYFAIYKITVPF